MESYKENLNLLSVKTGDIVMIGTNIIRIDVDCKHPESLVIEIIGERFKRGQFYPVYKGLNDDPDVFGDFTKFF